MLKAWRNVTVICNMSVTKSFLLTETRLISFIGTCMALFQHSSHCSIVREWITFFSAKSLAYSLFPSSLSALKRHFPFNDKW